MSPKDLIPFLDKDLKPMVIQDNTIYPVHGFDEQGRDCVLGLDEKSRLLPLFRKTKEATKFTQLLMVFAGLAVAELIFRGLKRPLKQRDNKKADADKLVYVWRPEVQYQWKRSSHFASGQIEYSPPPEGAVFFVTVTLNKEVKYHNRYPQIHGWIEHWGWVGEDRHDARHPEGWKERYDQKVWDGVKTPKPARTPRRKK